MFPEDQTTVTRRAATRTSVEVHLEFPFAHHVVNPHYHPAASLTVTVSSELCPDPTSELFMMGVDGVAIRAHLEERLLASIAHHYIVWDQEVEQAAEMKMVTDKGVLLPQLPMTLWSVRPTVEVVMLVCLSIANRAVSMTNDPTARIERLVFAETARTSALVEGEQVQAAIEFTAELFDPIRASKSAKFADLYHALYGTTAAP